MNSKFAYNKVKFKHNKMSMSVVENSFQVIPPQQPSTEYKNRHLHESIIKSLSLNESQVQKNKLNNNAMPVIQTDMLSTFNPQVFRPFHQLHQPSLLNARANIQSSSLQNMRSFSENKTVKVNFSYGSNNINRNMAPQSAFCQGFNRNGYGFGMNVISRRSNNFFTEKVQSSSLDNNRPFSNLSELSKSKKAYLEGGNFHNNALSQFSQYQPLGKMNQQAKTHKLGKKFMNVKFNQNVKQRTDYGGRTTNLKTSYEFNDNNQTPGNNNISMLSMQRSEYVFLPQDKGQRIQIAPQSYVFSQNIIMSRPLVAKPAQQQANNGVIGTDHSLIFQVGQKYEFEEINIRADQQHYVPSRKSPKKIDNKVYLEDNNGLKTLQGKGSKLTELDNINRLSRITVKDHNQHEVLFEPNDILSKQDLNDFENHKNNIKPIKINAEISKTLEQPQITKKNQQDEAQTQKLIEKVSELQERLRKKEEQNENLLKRIENQQMAKKLNSQYQKLQLMSKLNEIEIKKLKNEIKMFQIKQKFYINNEQQKNHQINHLKKQLKSLKKGHLQINEKTTTPQKLKMNLY